jgi:hypothetical protein
MQNLKSYMLFYSCCKSVFTVIVVLFFFVHFSYAQNATARYEIDAKRAGTSMTDKDALPRSREFIRLDSTYYVGWMFEGIYKYDHSADYLGYKNAIPVLEKTLHLMEKDFGNNLRNIYSNIQYFIQNTSRYQDFFTICNALKECYDNIEMPDSVMALLDKIESYHFRRDYFGLYYQRAWTYHRNRFFTSKEHPFLKNSIAENEEAALDWCYKGFAFIEKYKSLNDAWFGLNQSMDSRLSIYHYLALLHCYLKNYDSANFYYQQLAMNGRIMWNNYGGMQTEIGNFTAATEYFGKDKDNFFMRGMLREPYYYLPELYIYAGKTKAAIEMTQGIIKRSGSTPGFGWYHIALARAYLYDGQLDSCEYALDKAANFKELHIGTTLTQTQYDFTINLLRVELADKKVNRIKFLNKSWWRSPEALYQLATEKTNKIMAEYVVANQLIYNPDRDRMVYDLFCSEATTSFDEAWFLLKDFSPIYFEKKYTEYQQTDRRINIQRYFKLFAAQFKLISGKEKDALNDFEYLTKNELPDTASEKLYIARLFEGASKASIETGNKESAAAYTNYLFETYPQLLPFSGIKIKMQLSVSGLNDDVTEKVIGDLKNANISWVTDDKDAVIATIQFEKRGNKYQALLSVRSANYRTIVSNQSIIFQNTDRVGGEIALRLFGKGGDAVFDPVVKQS